MRTTNTVLTNAFESLFDSGLFETQRQKRITHVIKTVRHTSDLHQSQIPKKEVRLENMILVHTEYHGVKIQAKLIDRGAIPFVTVVVVLF